MYTMSRQLVVHIHAEGVPVDSSQTTNRQRHSRIKTKLHLVPLLFLLVVVHDRVFEEFEESLRKSKPSAKPNTGNESLTLQTTKKRGKNTKTQALKPNPTITINHQNKTPIKPKKPKPIERHTSSPSSSSSLSYMTGF